MSLLMNFVRNQLLSALEAELANHAPEVKALIIQEIEMLAKEVLNWVENKILPQEEEESSE
jgi:recombinational DNA repair ATPase RecF